MTTAVVAPLREVEGDSFEGMFQPLEVPAQSPASFHRMHLIIAELGRLSHNPNPPALNAFSLVELIHNELVLCQSAPMKSSTHESLKGSIQSFDLEDTFWLVTKNDENKDFIRMFREALTSTIDCALQGDLDSARDRFGEACTTLEVILDERSLHGRRM